MRIDDLEIQEKLLLVLWRDHVQPTEGNREEEEADSSDGRLETNGDDVDGNCLGERREVRRCQLYKSGFVKGPTAGLPQDETFNYS